MSISFRTFVIATILIIFLGLTFLSYLHYKYPLYSQRIVNVEPRVFGEIAGKRITPTHVFFDENQKAEVISDFNNNRFVYRKLNSGSGVGDWQVSNIADLKKPHAITYDPVSSRYYAVDTSNNRMLSFRSFDGEEKSDLQSFIEINGTSLGKRPHDIAYNPVDKYIYLVLNTGILRFATTKDGISNSDFISKKDILKNIRKNFPGIDFAMGYVRSLTIVEGRLYLSNSTRGNIIQIGDFLDPSTWIVHFNKKQPYKYAEKGSFDKNGLILNDIEYYKGYWYATNYYAGTVHNYLSDASVSKNKLMRWKTWEDFENSKWEDLSSLVHGESITYYFSKYDDRLYLSMFHIGNKEGFGSGVYEIKTSYF